MNNALSITLLALSLAAFIPGCKTAETKVERPNIIFLLTDDQRENSLGVTGHPFVHTPNIDRLAQQGVRFSNAYIAEPTCSPSRVSLFTGIHERIHGIGFSSSYRLTEEQWAQSYPELLRRNGYYTGFIGKFGVQYYTFQSRSSEKFDFWRAHDGWTKFFPKEWDLEPCLPYHDAGPDIITPIMGESIEMFLDSAETGKPFCLSVSFNVPHGSQTQSMYTDYDDWMRMSRPANENPMLQGTGFYDELYRDIPIRIPEDCETDPYRFIPREIMDQDKGRNKTYSYSYNKQTCLEHHIRYYQQIAGLDHIIGKMLISLQNRGLADNTVIIYSSDHGLLMGEYGMGGKALLYDLSSEIPCIVYDPRLPVGLRGRTLTELVSSLDITATILDYAGLDKTGMMQGSSLVPLVMDEDVEWREYLFLENLFTMRDNPFCEGIRQGKWKYIRMYDGVIPYREKDIDFQNRDPEFEQLFNLDEDPGERNNLAGEFEGTALLDSLRSLCARHSIELNQARESYKTTMKISVRR
jgi:arylsulfatase A-like enzyme